MVRSLQRISRPDPSVEVERVGDQATADLLAKAARARQLLPEHLEAGAPLRRYVAWDRDEIVGWVGSISFGEVSYCDNMYVREDQRRRGIASAMLWHMLRDDRAGGAKHAVLLASHMGALLYPNVGYEQVGTLYIYQPGKRRPV
jgi:GNAT superfamily N-acetyltransferase